MVDLSEIEDFTWTFFKLFVVGFFFSCMKYSPINRIIEYDFAIRIFGRFFNIRVFDPIPSLQTIFNLIFKRHVLQTGKNKGMFWKGLMHKLFYEVN